jgi:hypothetical protein
MSFLNSVIKSVRTRPFFAMSSALVMVAGMLFGANIANADSVWVQSYQRSSQTEACTAQPGETPWQASWGADPSWSPSWEMWANNGNGGWVCTRSITWARTPVAPTNASSDDPVLPVTCTEPVGGADVDCAVGKIGPGGGLVFLISGGKTYEMAPKNWDDPTNVSAVDPTSAWCSNTSSLLSGTFGAVVGTGQANTALMAAPACTSGAANEATAYSGGGFTDWFLPSKDELNAMCYYSRNLSASPDPTVSCIFGTSQDGTFASGAYGFVSDIYLSSGFLALLHFIYLSLLFVVFLSWLPGRRAVSRCR